MAYRTTQKNFADKHEAIDWIISNQLGRRNVTEENKSYLRGIQSKNQKAQIGQQENRGNRFSKVERGQNVPALQRTREKLAEEHNVSPKAI